MERAVDDRHIFSFFGGATVLFVSALLNNLPGSTFAFVVSRNVLITCLMGFRHLDLQRDR